MRCFRQEFIANAKTIGQNKCCGKRVWPSSTSAAASHVVRTGASSAAVDLLATRFAECSIQCVQLFLKISRFHIKLVQLLE